MFKYMLYTSKATGRGIKNNYVTHSGGRRVMEVGVV